MASVGHNGAMTTTGSTPEELPIRDEMIRLGQALKLGSLVEDGAMARTRSRKMRSASEAGTRRATWARAFGDGNGPSKKWNSLSGGSQKSGCRDSCS